MSALGFTLNALQEILIYVTTEIVITMMNKFESFLLS